MSRCTIVDHGSVVSMSSVFGFDDWLKRLQASGKDPDGIVEAASYVKDTLELSKAIAFDLFGPHTDSAEAIAIYQLVNEEQRRRKAKG